MSYYEKISNKPIKEKIDEGTYLVGVQVNKEGEESVSRFPASAIDEFKNKQAEQARVKAEEAQAKAEEAQTKAEKASTRALNAISQCTNPLKGSKSGEVVAVTDASPIEHEMGVKVKSANILPYPYIVFANGDVQSKAGITITNQGDRGVYIKGTSTAQEGFKLADIDLGSTWTDASSGVESATTKDGKYTISKYLYYDHTKKAVYVGVKAGVTVDEIIYPQVVEGSVLTPYIEDISIVKVKKLGKNLFNIANIVDRKNNDNGREVGVKKIENDTALQVSTSSTSAGSLDQRSSTLKDLAPELRVGKTYTLSANTTGMDAKIYLTLSKAMWTFGTSRTLTDDDLNSTVVWYASGSGTTAVVSNIQIEDNTGATEYEPYIEPIEYPVSADGIVEGVKPYKDTTTLMTDTAGAVIDCTYNRDINKAFEELYNAIISTGGNV